MGDRRQHRNKAPTQSKSPIVQRPRERTVRNICVYCGSGAGADPAFAQAARDFGRSLAENDIGLVFGGGGRGLMGEVARATLAHGGRVTGIIPKFLVGPEHAIQDVDDLVITDSMHERKRQMFERSDAFVALPGGIGTLEEFVEQLTWNQIGQHDKPLVLANVSNYWKPLVALFEHMNRNHFIRAGLEVHFSVVDRVEDIVSVITQRLADPRARAGTLSSGEAVPPEKL